MEEGGGIEEEPPPRVSELLEGLVGGWGAGTPFVATESEGSIDADAYSVGAEEMWVKIVRDLEHEVACVATWPGDDEDAARECCNAYP